MRRVMWADPADAELAQAAARRHPALPLLDALQAEAHEQAAAADRVQRLHGMAVALAAAEATWEACHG